MFAHCYRSGEIEISEECNLPGCIEIGEGTKEELEAKLAGRARLAYDGKTFLVPGIPEADDDEAAFNALVNFKARMERPVARA